MESYASLIGLTIPFSAKRAVMKEQERISSSPRLSGGSKRDTLANIPIFSFGNASMAGCKHLTLKDLLEDDETASTTSATDDDESCSFSVYSDCRSEMAVSVTFATPLITDIHYRPRTLRQDKHNLFYTDAEYRSFRRDFDGYHCVRFMPEVVTHVYECDSLNIDEGDYSSLYYSEAEIQGCVPWL